MVEEKAFCKTYPLVHLEGCKDDALRFTDLYVSLNTDAS